LDEVACECTLLHHVAVSSVCVCTYVYSPIGLQAVAVEDAQRLAWNVFSAAAVTVVAP